MGFGQTVCTAVNPKCSECLNNQLCSYGKGQLRSKAKAKSKKSSKTKTNTRNKAKDNDDGDGDDYSEDDETSEYF